jgi:hypothetical protein
MKVTVNQQPEIKIQSLSYGVRTLKGATDLNMGNAQDGDVIVYNSATNSFSVEPIYDIKLNIDNGFF